MKKYFFDKFPNLPKIGKIIKGQDSYVYFSNSKKLLDLTSGRSTLLTLGYSNKEIIRSITDQLKKFPHIDCNIYENPQAEVLSNLLIKFGTNGLNKVYYSGSSGSEAIEAAMKLSFQIHLLKGKKNKLNFISRLKTYHGATLQAMSVSDFKKFYSYKGLLPKNIHFIPEHNPNQKCFSGINNICSCGSKKNSCGKILNNESIEDYTKRSVQYLRETIKNIGSENICAFIGETQLSSEQGNSIPANNYWREISKVCKKNDIHLILDEIYCGGGRSGKYFNYTWDNVTPDFVCIGKNFTSGYAPLSAVVTHSKYQDIIAESSGEFYHGHTFAGYSVGISAALMTLRIIRREKLLKKILKDGDYMRKVFHDNLKSNKNFINVNGRGLLFSINCNFKNNINFAKEFVCIMRDKYKILISCRPNKILFAPTYIMTKSEIDYCLEKSIKTFKQLSLNE
jgi:adenosylmethionine-8-amino-7-oxononanoate aminotransferase